MNPVPPSKNEKITAGTHVPYWIDSFEILNFKTLNENLPTDAVIVGGGIAGITIAYCLVQSGLKVILVEDGYIGSGETGRTTAHLVSALDDRYYELETMYGKAHTKLIADSHVAAINFIENTIKKENIHCDFERLNGYLFLHPSDERQSLEKELHAAHRAGLDVKEISHVPGMPEGTGPCLQFSNQAQFHPLKYLRGLCNVIEKKGGHIFTNTHADKIDEHGITTNTGFTIAAKHVIVATDSPVNNKYLLPLKQYSYRTYVIGARIKKDSLMKALWWDTGDHASTSHVHPYHYIRLQKLDDEYNLLLCGGEDHPTGLADNENIPETERYKLLETWTREKFKIEDVIYKWSGQVMEPIDSLAYIGHNPMDKKNIYVVTGDSGNGITHATIAGILITDLVQGRKNKWEKIYDPSRFKLFNSGKMFFKELIGGVAAYLKNKPHNTATELLHSLKKDEAKIIEIDKKKYGAYRDEYAHLHIVSAECMHLGCIVKWNGDEKSWDCPCHGSRFTYEGKVINGPANKDLPYYQDTSEKTEMSTLVECINMLYKRGFKENFLVKEKGLCLSNSEKCYTPEQVRIVSFYRFEGESDPADNSILYAIETEDGKKGVLSDAYGSYSDTKVTAFMNEVEEMEKAAPL